MAESEFVQKLIAKLHLEPLQMEGGLFFQSYRSVDEIPLERLPKRYPSRRRFSSAIYYLLTNEADSFSTIHIMTTLYHQTATLTSESHRLCAKLRRLFIIN